MAAVDVRSLTPGMFKGPYETGLLEFVPVMIAVNVLCAVVTYIGGKGKSKADHFFLYYFFLSAIIHTTIENYWSRNSFHIMEYNDWIGRMWREFAKCDSRWYGPDPTIFGLELMAGWFCAPTAWLTVYAIIFDKPWRHVIQPVCVVAQAYGLLDTWFPEIYENMIHVPIHSGVLHWGYFWALQSPWFFIPIAAVWQSWCYVSNLVKKSKDTKKKN